MRTIKIYFDHLNDCLTFTNHRRMTAPPIAVVQVPDETRRDGDCVILPDNPYAVFKQRRVSATELYIRANAGWGEGIHIAAHQIRGMHTFSTHGKPKAAKPRPDAAGSNATL